MVVGNTFSYQTVMYNLINKLQLSRGMSVGNFAKSVLKKETLPGLVENSSTITHSNLH